MSADRVKLAQKAHESTEKARREWRDSNGKTIDSLYAEALEKIAKAIELGRFETSITLPDIAVESVCVRLQNEGFKTTGLPRLDVINAYNDYETILISWRNV